MPNGLRGIVTGCAAIGIASAAPAFAQDETIGRKDDPSLPVYATPAAMVVLRGEAPKSIEVPGTGVSFSLVGYAKVDFIQDFDSIGDRYEFRTSTIAIDGTEASELDGQTTVHARETRFGLDFRKDDDRFRAYFEGDFFGDGNAFRLRHAYGELRNLLGGQTWTTFMDISVRPRLVDHEGPDAEIHVRRGLIRFHHDFNDRVAAAVAIESPTPQFAIPGAFDGEVRSNLPELPAYVRWSGERRHVQLAGILRQLRFDGTTGSADASATGWGLSATGKAMFTRANEVLWQFAFGEGIAGMLSGFNGLSLDAVLTAAGEVDPLMATGVYVGLAHHFGPRAVVEIVYSQADLDAAPGQPGTTIVETRDVHVDGWWKAHDLVQYGAALMWGRIEQESGASGEAVRLQLAAKYTFN